MLDRPIRKFYRTGHKKNCGEDLSNLKNKAILYYSSRAKVMSVTGMKCTGNYLFLSYN